jgi:ABC-2 type transport system permease protein
MTTMVTHSAHISVRHLRAIARQPWYLAITLVQPVIWLLLFGQLFKQVAELPGFTTGSYIAFLTPGIVVMTALFSNGWAGMGFIQDIDRGVLDRMLVSPARRGSLIAGQLGFQAVTTVIQSLVILGLGFLAGARFHGGPLAVALFLVCTVLLGTAFAALSDAFALLIRKEESVIAAVQFLVLPLSFLSTVFMPTALVPSWIQDVARYNPVNWAVEAGRQTLEGEVDWGLLLSRTGLLLLLAVVMAWLATRAFRSYQRSV